MQSKFLLVIVLWASITVSGCQKTEDENSTPARNVPLVVTALHPESGRAGSTITISGRGFSPVAHQNNVLINGKAAVVKFATDSSIQVIIPSLAGSGPVIVTVDGQTATGPLFRYDSIFVRSLFVTGLKDPNSLVVDKTDNLFITNNANGVITKVTPQGTATNYATVPYHPRGIVIDKQGNIFVAIYTNGSVSKITPAGVVSSFASRVLGDAMVIDRHDNLYLNGYGGGFIQKVTPAGVVTAHINDLHQPKSLALDSAGNFFVAENRTVGSFILKITPDGVKTTVATGTENPYGMCLDNQGNILVTDHVGGLLTKVTPGGVKTTVASGFHYPLGVAVDSKDNIYVVNAWDGSVYKLTVQ